MSTPNRGALLPAAKSGAGGKKRRPNFRPARVPASAAAKSTTSKQLLASPSASQELPKAVDAQNQDASVAPEIQNARLAQSEEPNETAAESQPVVQDQIVKEPPLAKGEVAKKQKIASPSSEPSETAAASALTESPKKSRKRRKIGVPVGSTRVAIDASQVDNEPPLLDASAAETTKPAAVPAAAQGIADPGQVTSGEPTLASFCSKFRVKRTKRDKATDAADKAKGPAAPVVHDTAEDDAAPEAVTAPQVQVINGEIVLNEASIIVAGTTPAGNRADTEDYTVVEEEAQLAVVGASYNSFVSRRAPQHWTVDETKLFYDALRQVGTDFGTMEAYFNKTRTRKQLKRKFQIESTKNPHLIDNALNVESIKEIGT